MRRRFTSLRGMTALGAASLISALFAAAPVQAHHGGHGGGGGAGVHHGGVYGGAHHYGLGGFYGHGYPGLYRHNFYGPGFYRPYYGYGLGLGLGGFGLGYGLGAGLGGFGLGGYGLGGYGLGGYGLGGYGLGGYGLGGYGLGGYGLGGFGRGGLGMGGYGGYAPYYGGAAYPIAAGMPPGQAPTPPPPDNAAHLQLVVPSNAEVRIDGYKTNQTGTVREFFSPPLTAGTNYTYSISVRYTDAAGKAIDDARTIYVRANDWFRIDFTKPPPPETPRQP